ncbi:MAG TPA: hypothetical protein VJW96_09340 [Terriglobales bacterium]|jgi:hypothetical protein|nr:hypothetical protein [Terriglobales bacterium]
MHIISDNIGAWLAATVVALMTVFSDKLLERIRFKLNRADLRTKYFEELAMDLSSYIFFAELFCERHQRKWANDPDDMGAIGGEVNEAVTILRKKEYVYRSWIRKYWDEARLKQFAEVMGAVKSVEDALHAFNDGGGEEEKTTVLARKLGELRTKAERWISQIT